MRTYTIKYLYQYTQIPFKKYAAASLSKWQKPPKVEFHDKNLRKLLKSYQN